MIDWRSMRAINKTVLEAEIRLHVNNPNRREGEENLSLLVTQEAVNASDEDRKWLDATIQRLQASDNQEIDA